jgi:hypothetical protein
MVYWARSFVPIEKKSTSGANCAAWSASAGHDADLDLRAAAQAGARLGEQRPRGSHLLQRRDHREHHLQRMFLGHAQNGA